MMSEQTSSEDEAVRAGAELERSASEPAGPHHPRTDPVSSAQKQALDAAITGRD